MAGSTWLVDGNRFATKIRSASGTGYPESVQWKSNPTRACPRCQHVIDNSDVAQEWPGLPRGVKFDPSDQEIMWHLLAKVGAEEIKRHPFIDEFIPTLNNDDGIYYTHPQKLPGVKQDGSASHFFYKSIKAYNTGTRKRRKISDDDFGDVRWHKTGRTKAVVLDGVQKGCKKIMVLYMSFVRGAKAEKTNWVMHQYHLGTEEDEKDGEYVISKIFYQQQQGKVSDKMDQDFPETSDMTAAKNDPLTPKSSTPDPPRAEQRCIDLDLIQESTVACTDEVAMHQDLASAYDELEPQPDKLDVDDQPKEENLDDKVTDTHENQAEEEPKWWDSQTILDSQQLVEGLTLCEDLFQSESPDRGENGDGAASKGKSFLSEYAKLGPEHLKKDLEDCQNLVLDPENIELETLPEFRLSQLEFGSQDSFLAWGGKVNE